jgi:hypothetical protein
VPMPGKFRGPAGEAAPAAAQAPEAAAEENA